MSLTDPHTPNKPQILNEDGHTVSSSTPQSTIIEGDQNNFIPEVIESSNSQPVLVDFWAEWCSPCKQLTPILEKTVRATKGQIKLVKLNIDSSPHLVQQLAQVGLPIQSIPLVAAFWKGEIIDLLQGAQPESAVHNFIEQILKASGGSMPGAGSIQMGQDLLDQHKIEEAMGAFSQALEADPSKGEAWAGMLRCLLIHSGSDGAMEFYEQIPEDMKKNKEVIGAKSAIDLAIDGEKAQKESQSLIELIKKDPKNFQARFEYATALNASHKRKEAAEQLLEIIRKERHWNNDAARNQLFKFFESWGMNDKDTLEARRQLSSLLFS
ncbi:hypothetical protein COMNV_00747 [Commensalibacter sp. Nvir]|uniref:co-chaperone YbbN n=1 Tax=Commensalibacter sp. Nvir TaxID=3069817 RepID=UPI002D3A5D59|nr:hypothetical protein COMNV_00747 [Commensalibacter sp. Nvir]